MIQWAADIMFLELIKVPPHRPLLPPDNSWITWVCHGIELGVTSYPPTILGLTALVLMLLWPHAICIVENYFLHSILCVRISNMVTYEFCRYCESLPKHLPKEQDSEYEHSLFLPHLHCPDVHVSTLPVHLPFVPHRQMLDWHVSDEPVQSLLVVHSNAISIC